MATGDLEKTLKAGNVGAIGVSEDLAKRLDQLSGAFTDVETRVEKFKKAFMTATTDSTKDINLLENKVESLAMQFNAASTAAEKLAIAGKALLVVKEMEENKLAVNDLVKSLGKAEESFGMFGKNKKTIEELTEKKKDLIKQLEDMGKNLGVNSIEVKKLTDDFKALEEEGKDLKKMNDALQEIGSAVSKVDGLAGAFLNVATGVGAAKNVYLELLKLTWNFYEHTALVNRQQYDLGAALGHVGEKTLNLEDAISRTTEKFLILPDEARKTQVAMAGIGFTGIEIAKNLERVYELSALWSEATPENQIKLMSTYIKEFGMDGDKAWKTMYGLYETAFKLKGEVSNLNIKDFMEQTQTVAINMRKYGLETSDAIALTSTLVKEMGIKELGRVSEIAQILGAAGMTTPATIAYMSEKYLQPQMRGRIKELEKGGITDTEKEEYDNLKRRERIAERGPVGAMGVMLTATGEERTRAQMGFLEEMVKIGAGGRGLTGKGAASIEEVVGTLSQLDLPGIGKMTIEQAKIFGEGVKKLTDKGISLDQAVQTELGEAAKSQKTAVEAAKARETTAHDAALATKSIAEDVGIMKGYFGQLIRKTVYGAGTDTIREEEFKKMAWEKKGKVSDAELKSTLGLSDVELGEFKKSDIYKQEVGRWTPVHEAGGRKEKRDIMEKEYQIAKESQEESVAKEAKTFFSTMAKVEKRDIALGESKEEVYKRSDEAAILFAERMAQKTQNNLTEVMSLVAEKLKIPDSYKINDDGSMEIIMKKLSGHN